MIIVGVVKRFLPWLDNYLLKAEIPAPKFSQKSEGPVKFICPWILMEPVRFQNSLGDILTDSYFVDGLIQLCNSTNLGHRHSSIQPGVATIAGIVYDGTEAA